MIYSQYNLVPERLLAAWRETITEKQTSSLSSGISDRKLRTAYNSSCVRNHIQTTLRYTQICESSNKSTDWAVHIQQLAWGIFCFTAFRKTAEAPNFYGAGNKKKVKVMFLPTP